MDTTLIILLRKIFSLQLPNMKCNRNRYQGRSVNEWFRTLYKYKAQTLVY